MLSDRYLLRKNSVVQIAGGVIHHSTKIWGADADSFNPERFLTSVERQPATNKEPNQACSSMKEASPLPKGVPSAAFRAFGGGTVICPGRHFAQSELMTLVAVLALGFEIEEMDGGTLRLPAKDDERIPLAVMKPLYDPRVNVRRRTGWENVVFEVDV